MSCPECWQPTEVLYGPAGAEVCINCYDDLTAWPDMGDKAWPRMTMSMDDDVS